MKKTMGEKIIAAMNAAGMSQRQLAAEAIIPEATLRRKLVSGDFTVPEAERIAVALGVDPLTILPDSLLSLRVAA